MISDRHLAWLESRGISAETAVRHGLSTVDGSVLAFPFIEGGKAVGTKFRGPNKKFWQNAPARKTFWNADALDDPGLAAGTLPLIITEGEIDAMTAIECGWPLAVSVPEGAPNETDTVAEDDTGKLACVYNNRDRLKRVKRFVLAVDNDAPGQRLAAELVRRLGAGRCAFVTYPEGCKDLNDTVVAHGSEAVTAVINGAKPYPTTGLYQLSDYPAVEPIRRIGTGWATLDKHFGLFPGAFTVVTGVPSHGKTTWVMNLSCNIARLHGWRTAVFSPEMPTVPHLHNKLRRIASGGCLERLMANAKDLRATDQFLNDAFVFIDADPETGPDEEMTLDWVIGRARDAVHRYGIKHLVIDPWNEVEHDKPRDVSMPDYIGQGIRLLKRFAKTYQVAVTVIVHPTKAVGGDEPRTPNLYDCEGSAHWFNKPDLGVIVGQEAERPGQTLIRIAKVRFDETGEKGDVFMKFNRDSCRFEMLDLSYQEAAE
jgi:twinkle protein